MSWTTVFVALLCLQCAFAQTVKPAAVADDTKDNSAPVVTTPAPAAPAAENVVTESEVVKGKPTKPPSSTTTTTTEPTTTTTLAPTTPPPTPKPTPAFPTNIASWNVTETINGTAVTCILFKGALELEITHPVDNKTSETVHVPVPADAIVSGNCTQDGSGTVQVLQLNWTLPGTDVASVMTFMFFLNNTQIAEPGPLARNHYAIRELAGSVTMNKTNNATMQFSFTDVYAYPTEESMSYHCLARETLTVPNSHVVVKFEQLQFQAFHKTHDAVFGAINGCAADGYVADIVPIAVGVSLALLVAIVLVAYLIGRRRSRARGYQSV